MILFRSAMPGSPIYTRRSNLPAPDPHPQLLQIRYLAVDDSKALGIKELPLLQKQRQYLYAANRLQDHLHRIFQTLPIIDT
jgi:hypothetical protein